MLGMLAVQSEKKHWLSRVTTARESIMGIPVLKTQIPHISNHALRRSAKCLTGFRVVVPDDFMYVEECRFYGMTIVEARSLYPRIAHKIVNTAITQLGLSAQYTVISIIGGRIDSVAREIVRKLAYEARYLCINCPGSDALCDELTREIGVSVLIDPPPKTFFKAHFKIEISAEKMLLRILHGEQEYEFSDVELILPSKFEEQVPRTHKKALAAAFLQNGLLRISDMKVQEVLFNNPKY